MAIHGPEPRLAAIICPYRNTRPSMAKRAEFRSMTRRNFMAGAIAVLGRRHVTAASDYPTTVAGIDLPTTRLCVAAAALSRSASPPFLFNHSLRTYVFGALHAHHHGMAYDPQIAFAAAMLHDLGLLPAYEHDGLPFEIDSANAAEDLARRNGLSDKDARRVWDATVMHDMRRPFVERQSAEVILVASGAGADVTGPDPDMFDPRDVAEVVRLLPRLGFKAGFKNLLTRHCLRKAGSQNATWLDSYCRATVIPGHISETATAIDKAPFPD